MTAPRVVVVGGGLAGLSAALELADGGAAVTLLERRPRLGGATWSFQRRGLWFDNGQHVFLRCCTAYIGFLERIGATSFVHLQDRLDVPVAAPGRRTARLRRGHLPAPLHLAQSLARYHHLPVADRARIGRAALALRRIDLTDPALDQTTFAEFLRRRGQHPAAIERLWDVICTPTVNLRAADASLLLAATVFKIGLLTEASAGDIGWARVPLSKLHAEPARAALERAGASVRTGAGADAVQVHEDGGTLTVHVAGGEAFDADAAIVAVPHHSAARLLGEVPGCSEQARTWADLGTSPIVNIHLVYDRRVMDEAFVAGVDTPLQFVFDRTASSGLREGQCLAVSLSAADEWLGVPSDELVAMADAELRRLFPAGAGATRIDAVVTREQAATFRGVPGTQALRPGPRTAIPNLYLAGAWTDTGWPATMEGAVRSGLAAARALLAEHAPAPRSQEVLA